MNRGYFGFEALSVRYDRKNVLKDMSLDIRQGKITTLIGKNGCGKSSLLKTVFEAVKPSSGNVYYRGKSVKSYGSKELAKKIAYLPQVHEAPPDVDVKTLVSYGRFPFQRFGRGLTKEDYKIVDDTISFTGLTELKDRKMSELSGGERQRAWIAMAVCRQPEILILDEPTTYLDVGHQIDVLELVRRMNTQMGTTIIMVLHDVNLAARYSDDLYAIRNGNICCEGCPNEMVTRERMKKIFDVDAEIYRDVTNNCPYFIPLKTLG